MINFVHVFCRTEKIKVSKSKGKKSSFLPDKLENLVEEKQEENTTKIEMERIYEPDGDEIGQGQIQDQEIILEELDTVTVDVEGRMEDDKDDDDEQDDKTNQDSDSQLSSSS